MTFFWCQTFAYMKQIFPKFFIFFFSLFPRNFLANNTALIGMKKEVVQQNIYFAAIVICHAQVFTDIFTTTLSESYKQEMRWGKLKRKNFQKILKECPYYQYERTWGLQLKGGRDSGQSVPVPNVTEIWGLGFCACVYLVRFQFPVRRRRLSWGIVFVPWGFLFVRGRPAAVRGVFGAGSGSRAGWCSAGGSFISILQVFLLVLAKFSFWPGDWVLSYYSMKF